MPEVGPKNVDALLDCEDAFDTLGAPQPGDAALLQRAIGSTLAATPSGGTPSGAAGGLPTTFWLAILAGVLAVVAVFAWPSSKDADPPATAAARTVQSVEAPEAVATPPDDQNARAAAADGESDAATSARSSEPREAPPPAATPPPAKPRAPSLSAAQLLEQANAARRAGQGRRALALYGRLFKTYPRSREASTARVSAGRLHLDQRNAKAALAQFRKYLSESPRGSLAEEAAAGRAMALGQLGRPEAEREAWTSLLQSHPGSVHAARARKRIAELSAD